MILQNNEWTRFFAVVIAQSLACVIFLFIAFNILKRNRKRIGITASGLYLSLAIGLILNLIYFSLKINPLVHILYSTTIFLWLFGIIFLLQFNFILKRSEKVFTITKQLGRTAIYGVVLLIILLIPGGITIDESTNWTPHMSWTLLVILYVFITTFMIIPLFYTSIKLYGFFNSEDLKKRWKIYIIGLMGLTINFYGLILYAAWINPVYRSIWTVVSILSVISAITIYFGLGHNL